MNRTHPVPNTSRSRTGLARFRGPRWIAPLLRAALLLVALAGLLHSTVAGPEPAHVAGWALAAVLGLTAVASERRARREAARRLRSAQEHRRAIEELRRSFALDTHDTIAHGLTTQAAIVSVLTARDGSRPAQLTELALVTAHTQQQLRALLARLSGSARHPDTDVAFEIEFRTAVEARAAILGAGGFEVELRLERLPQRASSRDLETSLFLFQELATNIVKHSAARSSCLIAVDSVPVQHRTALHLSSRNPGTFRADGPPRSLALRARTSGGTCTVRERDERVAIDVLLPLAQCGGAHSPHGIPA